MLKNDPEVVKTVEKNAGDVREMQGTHIEEETETMSLLAYITTNSVLKTRPVIPLT